MQKIKNLARTLLGEIQQHKSKEALPKELEEAVNLLQKWLGHEDQVERKDSSFALRVFSDGACRGNPGPGAWGLIGKNQQGEIVFESTGVELFTTNNQMELQGAICGLIEAKRYFDELNLEPMLQELELVTDSKYVVDGITKWVSGWKKRGWKKSDGKAPENLSQWKEFEELSHDFKRIKFSWVKGHAGHEENEICDQLANDALDKAGF